MNEQPDGNAGRLGRGRVLFLCDRAVPDPAVGTVAAEMGYELVRASSLDEAMAHARPPGFALILAGYSGNVNALFDSVRRLRAALPGTPVIAHGIPPQPPFTLESLYDAGALAVLHDPVSAPILKAKARFFLDAYATAAERGHAEAALEEAHARLEAIIAAADVAVWTLDVATRRVSADARMAELFGLHPDSAAGAPLRAYFGAIHPDDAAPTMALLEAAMAGGTPYDATFRVRAGAGGTWRWVLARGQLDRSGGSPGLMRGVIIDATVQKQAEEKLQASEERYRTLFDAIDEGVCVIDMLYDAGGNPSDYRFIEVNPAFVRDTGLEDAVGRTVREMLPLHENHWFEAYGRVAATGEAVHFVNEAAQLNRWYDVYAARVGPAGSRRVVVLFTDITERRRTEQELRRLADDLAEQDRRKTEFLATLAHELRNPLAPIRSGLQLLRRARGDAVTTAKVEAIMDRQLDHLVHLVDDLLDVARITQVVSNLLNNAAKYTPPGGHIVLAAERDGNQVLIAVSDNGIGIPAGLLEDVFRMFTQVAQAAQHKQGGLGIGLSLVRSLVEMHGGSIHAASGGTGAGSVFTVRLPLAERVQPQAGPAAHAGAAPSAGLRVLVVDDNRDAADTLAAVLGMMGHAVAVAHDGHQALRMLPGLQPQAVFLDIGMPGMSGYDVARAVRKDCRWDAVRLIALTGWGGQEDRARTAEAGFDDHLTKPATVAAIEAALAATGAAQR